jgi:hypothetical protein
MASGTKYEGCNVRVLNYCNLPNVHGAIDNTHIYMSKPKISFAKDYFYYKTRGYSIVA